MEEEQHQGDFNIGANAGVMSTTGVLGLASALGYTPSAETLFALATLFFLLALNEVRKAE